MRYTVIPDIHGHAEKLDALLSRLGWARGAAGWQGETPDSELVFLGDLIDRGPENARTISIVRDLVDSGKAHIVMGNHELNAIYFHNNDPKSSRPLRAHNEKNIKQHSSFLNEFEVGAAQTKEVMNWFQGIPLYRDFGAFRCVHACWNSNAIAQLEKHAVGGALPFDYLLAAADSKHELYQHVETTTKGPEASLPAGFSFRDKDNNPREEVRVQWWKANAKRWSDVAMSVPESVQLPTTELPTEISSAVYSRDAKPVFFGHYWMTGQPIQQAANALCLDYSAGKDGPLIAYQIEEASSHKISLFNIVGAEH